MKARFPTNVWFATNGTTIAVTTSRKKALEIRDAEPCITYVGRIIWVSPTHKSLARAVAISQLEAEQPDLDVDRRDRTYRT